LNIFKLNGVAIVWTVHNLLSHDSQYPRLEYFYNRFIARLAKGIVAHTHYAKEEIGRYYRINTAKVSVIPHGHYIHSYPNNISRDEARTKLQISDTDHVFLYFGLIRAYKGIPELIDSFLKMNRSDVKLLIVGKPNEQTVADEIRDMAKNSPDIRFVFDYVKDEDVQVYMNASDIVVLPYRDIFTSGVVLLGMSFVKPIIASRKGSIPEVLDHNGGFLFDDVRSDELRKLMEEVCLKDKNELEMMGKHNLESVSKYDWKTISARTYDLYKGCLN